MPIKKSANAPKTEADAAREAAIAAQESRRAGGALLFPAPNGSRMEFRPAIEPRFQGMDVTQMLGDPATILKNPKPGYKYVWKRKNDRQTAAWIRSGILRPVEVDEIDTNNPGAQYFEDAIQTPGDMVRAVCWEQQALFEMSPKWADRIYGAAEELAVARIAQKPKEFAEEVDKLTSGAYSGSFSVRSDK